MPAQTKESNKFDAYIEELSALFPDDKNFAALLDGVPDYPARTARQKPFEINCINPVEGSGRARVTVKRFEEPAEPEMTERQLRALSKKHLLIMIRDLKKALNREKKEKENLLLAYQAGSALWHKG